MAEEEDCFGIPPPPQKIFDHLNGHLIGHYIMKKALSVAVYNHYCDVGIKSKLAKPLNVRVIGPQTKEQQEQLQEQQQKDQLDEEDDEACERVRSDCKRYDFQEEKNNANNKKNIVNNNNDNSNVVTRKCSNDSGIAGESSPPKTGAYLTPIVARVIIEASSHKVHLRKTNTLTFDSTGSSRPLDAIASNLAKYLSLPYVRCDCRYIGPKRKVDQKLALENSSMHKSNSIPLELDRRVNSNNNSTNLCFRKLMAMKRRTSLQGSLGKLLEGYVYETLERVIGKLFKLSGYNKARTERGIIFLDMMENLGQNALDDEDNFMEIQMELYQEIMELIDGKDIKLRRPKNVLETLQEAEEERAAHINDNNNKENKNKSNADDNWVTETINTSNMFFICFGVNDKAAKEMAERNSRNKEMEQNKDEVNSKTEAISTKQSQCVFNNHSLDSQYSDEESEDDDDGSEDESFRGLKENKLAQMLLANQNSPIPQCQNLWGMKDVELKISPEALEIIANQATEQRAGADGVRTILEKLLFTVKFEILGKNVKVVEITEDFVLGRDGPIYHYNVPEPLDSNNNNKNNNSSVYPESVTSSSLRSSISGEFSNTLTEFDEQILEQLEL